MRTYWVAALVVMSACTTQGVDRARRWPDHRKAGDARFAELERRNNELEARVAKLEDWNAHVKVKKTPAPAADPPVAVPAPTAP